jgi:hypothetical protein
LLHNNKAMEGYKLIKVKEYYHQNPGTRPDYKPAYSYYKSLTEEVYTYRGVKITTIKNLHTDGSLFRYEVVSTSLPYLKGVDLEIVNVRLKIDKSFEEFEKLLNDKPLKCSYKVMSDGNLYDTAYFRTSDDRYNVLERRFILSDLINKGLPVYQALEFKVNI